MTCIVCDNDNEAKSIEHIVSESFGNKRYVMQRDKICDECNSKFSKFEVKALTNTVFVMERARFGIETKKGSNVKGRVKNLVIEGDKDFREQIITIQGISDETFENFDPQTKTGKLYVPSFDKSEVATSKLLLKTAFESIFTSQPQTFNKYSFTDLKDFLSGKSNIDWPFLTTDIELIKFNSVPKYYDKYILKRNHCELKFAEINQDTLLFKFKFGAIPMTINMLNRNLEWISQVIFKDQGAQVYPEHYRNKIKNLK